MAKREYSGTELGMSYGVVAGMLAGVLLFALTGWAPWIGLLFVPGLIVGMIIGQIRDRGEASDRGHAPTR